MTGLTQLVTQPTRGPNTLDLILNSPSSFGRVETMPGLSDHNIVFTELDINPQRAKQKPRDIPLYKLEAPRSLYSSPGYNNNISQ